MKKNYLNLWVQEWGEGYVKRVSKSIFLMELQGVRFEGYLVVDLERNGCSGIIMKLWCIINYNEIFMF